MSGSSSAQRLGEILSTKGLSVAVAESCTGGMIGTAITSVPGSSVYFRGGIIAYQNDVKVSLLGVSPELLREQGAVSEPVVIEMAKGAKRVLETDCAIAVSGVAGPGGGSEQKPVGLVYIGICVGPRALAFKTLFDGTREQIREQTVQRCLELLIEQLEHTGA